jgi:hypothetical protein
MAHPTRRDVLKLAAATGFLGVFGSAACKAEKHILGDVEENRAYRNGVLAKGPVGYWRLGEAQGPTAFDQTANAYNGTYFGNPTFGQYGAIHNDPNKAIRCNGVDYVEIPDSLAFSQPTSGFGLTVEVWMRPDVLEFPGETADPYVHWLGKGSPGQYEWALRFYSRNSTRPNRISAYIFNPAGGEGAGAYFEDTLEAGQWIHVVACYEPGDKDTQPPAGVHIYKNGVHRLGPPSPGTLYSNPLFNIVPAHGTAPLRLGTRDFGSFFRGGLDEVAIYPRVLSAGEILDNYRNGIS